MTVSLPTIPTLGFETKKCYAKAVYGVLARRTLIGRRVATRNDLLRLHNREMLWMYCMNINKAAGYIPVISTFAGISRLTTWTIAAARGLPFRVDNKVSFVARATLDICCLGWLLIPVDYHVTVTRHRWAEGEIAAAQDRIAAERDAEIAAAAGVQVVGNGYATDESVGIDDLPPEEEVFVGLRLNAPAGAEAVAAERAAAAEVVVDGYATDESVDGQAPEEAAFIG